MLIRTNSSLNSGKSAALKIFYSYPIKTPTNTVAQQPPTIKLATHERNGTIFCFGGGECTAAIVIVPNFTAFHSVESAGAAIDGWVVFAGAV